jgi:hypothetical protein
MRACVLSVKQWREGGGKGAALAQPPKIRTVLGALAGGLVLHCRAGRLASVRGAAEQALALAPAPGAVRAVRQAVAAALVLAAGGHGGAQLLGALQRGVVGRARGLHAHQGGKAKAAAIGQARRASRH